MSRLVAGTNYHNRRHKKDNKAPLVIPPAACRKAGFKSGQELEIKASDGIITIVPRIRNANEEHTLQERRRINRGIEQSLKKSGKGNSPVHSPRQKSS